MASLSLLAPCALIASDMPRALAWTAAAAVFAFGLLRLRTYLQMRHLELCLDARGILRVDDHVMRSVEVQWRGTLAFVQWRDARSRLHRRSFWPDTLNRAARRELRLAASALQGAGLPGPMSH